MKETHKIWVENTNNLQKLLTDTLYYDIMNTLNYKRNTMQTPKTFSLEIEKVAQDKNINHLDAVIWYCQKNELEPDSVGRLITKGLKEKIEANARELNFLEKTAQLPI